MEKAADEIFEELGYEKEYVKDKWDKIWGCDYIYEPTEKVIRFDYIDKEICVYDKSNVEGVFFDIQELKAINKKCQEMGWNE